MRLTRALEIVLDLAQENSLNTKFGTTELELQQDEALMDIAKDQEEAVNVCGSLLVVLKLFKGIKVDIHI